ncbi:hypothetical protein AGLY_002222, partial [Aphis glycines]
METKTNSTLIFRYRNISCCIYDSFLLVGYHTNLLLLDGEDKVELDTVDIPIYISSVIVATGNHAVSLEILPSFDRVTSITSKTTTACRIIIKCIYPTRTAISLIANCAHCFAIVPVPSRVKCFMRKSKLRPRKKVTTSFSPMYATYTKGTPAVGERSIPHSFVPLRILNNPLAPHCSPQELTISQYGVPFSSPHPIILTECPPNFVAFSDF